MVLINSGFRVSAREVLRQIKELHANCLAALQPRPQTICLKGFPEMPGEFFAAWVYFFWMWAELQVTARCQTGRDRLLFYPMSSTRYKLLFVLTVNQWKNTKDRFPQTEGILLVPVQCLLSHKVILILPNTNTPLVTSPIILGVVFHLKPTVRISYFGLISAHPVDKVGLFTYHLFPILFHIFT